MSNRYRLVEITDTLINGGKPYWVIEKKLFLSGWSRYFEEHSDNSAIYYSREEAEKWFNYHVKGVRIKQKVLKEAVKKA